MTRFRTLALLVAAWLIFAACSSGGEGDGIVGSDDRSSTTEAELDPVEPPEGREDPAGDTKAAKPSDLPRVEVIDVATEERLELTSLAPAERPILIWFWAPH